MKIPTVVFKNAQYDHQLKATVHEMLDTLLDPAIGPGTRVLIKPNLLMPARAAQGILTHPLVVRAVAEYVLARGARCRIGDSPAIGSFETLLKDGGYTQALADLDVDMAPFTVTDTIDIGPPFGRIALAADAFNTDVVINIAKLKAHVQMRLTLGVKNLFGCVVGLQKTEWHLRAGVARDFFARLLVQICRRVNPAVTLVDGIVGLEGQGPGHSGRPKPLGVIVGGRDPFAVDLAICRMLGVSPETLPTHVAARSFGWVGDRVNIIGTYPPIADFKLPVLAPLSFGPKFFRRFIRNHWIQRPVVDADACSLCGKCWRHCPARAITFRNRQLRFDYDACIRCYCCVEICREGALGTRETTAGIILRQLIEMRHRI